ncbi:hypothetical protein R3P38DRAFT_3313584 [Favolaschia claudopus]|uniref:Uncharacterized protein n=1 Tax=Favolaschia claudopus TaxID=2862362 RepID=A0AAW0BXA4_9AGAR
MPGSAPEFVEDHDFDEPQEEEEEDAEWRPALLIQFAELLQQLFSRPPQSSLFAERFKYDVISSSLLSTSLPVPHSHRRSASPSLPGKLKLDIVAPPPPHELVDYGFLSAIAVLAAVLLALGLHFLAVVSVGGAGIYLYNHSDNTKPDMSSTIEAVNELTNANAEWDSVVQQTVTLLEKEEESPPSPVSAIRLSLHSSLNTTQTQCDNVRHLLSALTAPLEAAQLAEMYAPPSPRHSLILPSPSSPPPFPEPRDKRSTWAGAPPGMYAFKTREKRRSDLSSILPIGGSLASLRSSHSAPSTPPATSLGDVREEHELGSEAQQFGAAALELHRRRRVSGVETLSGFRLHPSPTPPRSPLTGSSTISHASRFTTMQSVRHPLALSALHHALDGALASKRYACSHLLALRFGDLDDEGYWEDVRSVMALLTSTFADTAARLGKALAEAVRVEAEFGKIDDEEDEDVGVKVRVPRGKPGSELERLKVVEERCGPSTLPSSSLMLNGFAPVPTHLSRFAAHVDAISSALDDAREHLAECVAALREKSPAPEQTHLRRRRSRTFSLAAPPPAEAPALQAYERLRRELGLALRECERGRDRLLDIVAPPAAAPVEAAAESEEDSVPSLGHDGSDEEASSDRPEDAEEESSERQGDAVVVAPGDAAEVDDATAHLLIGASARHLPPPHGAEQVFEAEAVEVGLFTRERSKLTREERIKLAKERRSKGGRLSVDVATNENESGNGEECSLAATMDSFGTTSPFASNPLKTKADLAKFLTGLLDPLAAHTSPGGARIHLGHTATHFDETAAQLEGFSRPIWGLAALLGGGGEYSGRERWVSGLANGCDPKHEEFWGDMRDKDQRMVECSAIGFSIAVAREKLWDPLSVEAKANIEGWLGGMNDKEMPNTNWLWFRVFANLGLSKAGSQKFDAQRMKADLDHLDTFYIGGGWSRDGPEGVVQLDYYSSSFAIQFAQLIYSKLAAEEDPVRCEEYRNRARQFALDFVHYFDKEVAFADVELPAPLTWGVVKGLQLRNLRYWAKQPGAYSTDGTLTIGFCYPNHNMTENYNSPGSPYWCCKSFVTLSLPETHPFWAAEEEAYPSALLNTVKALKLPYHIATNLGGHTYILSSGQQCSYPVKQGPAKYGKLAYSSAFGYSVPVGSGTLEELGGDNTLALSDDSGETWKYVAVETWLVPPTEAALLWHLRVHRIRTGRSLTSAEGGFAIYGQREDGRALDPVGSAESEAFGTLSEAKTARAASKAGASGIVHLQGAQRKGTALRTDANTNLIVARAVLPTLIGEHEASESDLWLVTAVFALPSVGDHKGAAEGWLKEWHKRPSVPSEIAELIKA